MARTKQTERSHSEASQAQAESAPPPAPPPPPAKFRSFDDEVAAKGQGRSALDFIRGDHLIVGKSRLKSVKREISKPYEMTADNFVEFQKEDHISLLAAKSYLAQTAMSRNLTRLSFAGLDQMTDLFFKLIVDAQLELPSLTNFNCSGCPLITDAGMRWLLSSATNLNQVNAGGCTKITSATLSLLLRWEPSLDDIDLSGTAVNTVPVLWGNCGAGLKLDGCPLICPPYFKFISDFKTARERKTYPLCYESGRIIYPENQFKVVVVRSRDLEFSVAKFLKNGGGDTTPDTRPLSVFSQVAFGERTFNIFEVNRMQALQDLIISDGCILLIPFDLAQCAQGADSEDALISYLSTKVSFVLAKRHNFVPVLVGIDMSDMSSEDAEKHLGIVLTGVRNNVTNLSAAATKHVTTMTRRAWRVDDLDVHGQLYTGEAAASVQYLEWIRIFGEVIHVNQELDPASFLHKAFGFYKEEYPWMCINSTVARDLTNGHMLNCQAVPFSAVAEKAHKDAMQSTTYSNQMALPCLEQIALGLHQKGIAIFKDNVKGSPYISDMDWFAKVIAVVMDPPKQTDTLAKQIHFLSKSTPVWTDETLKSALGGLTSVKQFNLVVKLLERCGVLIKVQVDRLTKEMPAHVYVVSDTMLEDPSDIVDLDVLWPKSIMELHQYVQIDKFYRFTTGMSMSLVPIFFGRCAKFFKFTIMTKYGVLIKTGGVDLRIDTVDTVSGDPVVTFSARMEDQPLDTGRCRDHCLWSVMNMVTTIMDYCLKKEGISANVTIPCPTCIKKRTKVAADPDVYHYYVHLIKPGKDRGLKCKSPKYTCAQTQGEIEYTTLIGPDMDMVPKHLSYLLSDVSSSIPKFSRCVLCKRCAVDGKNCEYNGLQVGSLCYCGCQQTPDVPMCPGCGVCWDCTSYLKVSFYCGEV